MTESAEKSKLVVKAMSDAHATTVTGIKNELRRKETPLSLSSIKTHLQRLKARGIVMTMPRHRGQKAYYYLTASRADILSRWPLIFPRRKS